MAEKKQLPSGPQMAAGVLEQADRPVHVKLIAARVLEQDRRRKPAQRAYKGKTPEQTISAALTVSSNGGGTFVKVSPGVFALRSWPASKRNKSPERPEQTRAARQPSANGASSSRASSKRSGSKSAGSKSAGKKSGGSKGGKRPSGVDPQVAAHSEVISEGRSSSEPAPAAA